jgi:hypothetical protein
MSVNDAASVIIALWLTLTLLLAALVGWDAFHLRGD